jgi:hypothetical protein
MLKLLAKRYTIYVRLYGLLCTVYVISLITSVLLGNEHVRYSSCLEVLNRLVLVHRLLK